MTGRRMAGETVDAGGIDGENLVRELVREENNRRRELRGRRRMANGEPGLAAAQALNLATGVLVGGTVADAGPDCLHHQNVNEVAQRE